MVSKSKRLANKRWDSKHKHKKEIYRYRSAWRHFLKYDATLDDLREGKKLAKQREQELLK